MAAPAMIAPIAQSLTLTTNSVPRTPMMLDGVRMRIDSGDCFTILPETTASEPLLSEASNSPAWVVVSKRYLLITSTLFGPAENRLLSRNVMPTAPSAPVTMVSAWRSYMPAATGSFLPSRSTCAAPFTVLISPTSCAQTPVASANAPSAIIQRIADSFVSYGPPGKSYNDPAT